MRLSQLARKLDKTPSEIIHFYNTNNLGSYTTHNDKLEDEHVAVAISHFNPGLLAVEENDEPIIDMEENTDDVDIISVDEIEVEQSEVVVEEKMDSSDDSEEEIEVIRAPKIKLEGVKVVGKIDLPEKVIKTGNKEEDKDKIDKATVKPSKEREIRKYQKKSDRISNKYRSKQTKRLSYEERLKFEEKERKRKKREENKRKKELKKIYYKKNIQSNITSQVKKKSRKASDIQNGPKREIPVYKNPVRRLWAWLNGEYDKK